MAVGGDVPAEGRLIITDTASQNRRYLEWGLEQRYYDSATSLLVESDNMVVSGYSGFQTTRTGAYDPLGGTANTVIRGTLIGSPVAVCSSGTLGHVGTYRVKARVWASGTTEYLRLNWQEGDGPYRAGAYVTPPVIGAFSEVDLGLITIPPAQLGAQRWQGRVEAYTVGTPGVDTLDVDYFVLVPTEGYGRARAPLSYETITAPTARDEFNQTAGTLNAKTAPMGGAWTTSGATTDLAVEATGHTVTRNTNVTGTRYAVSGAAAQTDQIVQLDVKETTTGGLLIALARWTNSSNYLRVDVGNGNAVVVNKIVAGVATLLAYANPGIASGFLTGAWYTLCIYVDAAGHWAVWFAPRGSALGVPLLQGQDAVLATGGALASGKAGFADDLASAGLTVTRSFDNFIAATPTSPAVVYSGRTAEVRSDGVIRQDSTGTYYGPTPSYRGSRFMIPPAGDANRTTRILVKAHRSDIEAAACDNITDSLQIQVVYTPRYLVVPF